MSGVSWPSSGWSREEDKAFENGIAMYWSSSSIDDQKWMQIGVMVPGKSIQQLKHHYELLAEDVTAIEAGTIQLPNYAATQPPCAGIKERCREHNTNTNNNKSGFVSSTTDNNDFSPLVSGDCGAASTSSGQLSKGGSNRPDPERRKGIPWTEEEHRLFLLGLDKFGKGDWRSISRNFVISRTPTQVASHAQKYFIRLNSLNRERRRSSIHDITSPNHHDPPSPTLHHHNQHPHPPIGRPVSIPMGHHYPPSVLGTPVVMPTHQHHPPYIFPLGRPMPPPPPPHPPSPTNP